MVFSLIVLEVIGHIDAVSPSLVSNIFRSNKREKKKIESARSLTCDMLLLIVQFVTDKVLPPRMSFVYCLQISVSICIALSSQCC